MQRQAKAQGEILGWLRARLAVLEEISPETEVHTHRAALEKLALEFSTLMLCPSEVKGDVISSARLCLECGVQA